MTSFQIKSIACLLMLIDHVGAILFPALVWPRVVGRIAFPLFAWLLANSWQHTSSRFRYICRLLTFAFLSQIPYLLAFQPDLWRWNIFVSLSAGFISLAWIDKRPGWLGWSGVAFFALLSEWLSFDHGAYAIATIVCFGNFRGSFQEMAAAQVVLVGLRQAIVYSLAWFEFFSFTEWWVWAQPIALSALLIIFCYNGRRGFASKYAFYCFYPVHLLLLYWLR